MALQLQGATGTIADVEPASKAQRSVGVWRGVPFSLGATTGTVGAALAANSSVFAMRLDPSAAVRAHIERIRLQFTCLVAFTVPLTAGRRLGIYRGSGAQQSGGTVLADVQRKHSVSAQSEMVTAQGGSTNISTIGALTVTGITFEAAAFREMSLAHVGAAGNFYDCLFEFAPSECAPLILEPGQLMAIRNPVAMDAAGTWQLTVNVDWYEEAAL
jgi:hypothetical protein